MDLEEIIEDFSKKSPRYDQILNEVVPRYREMLEQMISFIPFEPLNTLRVLDLGCGTGNTTAVLLRRYPQADVTCIDLAAKSLDICKKRFSNQNVQVVKADIRDAGVVPANSMDCVMSSLAIHHLSEESQKYEAYKLCYRALKPGGFLIVGENVHGTSPLLTSQFEQMWIGFMRTSVADEASVQRYWQEYLEKDSPTSLMKQLNMLTRIGFTEIDCIWKYCFFAVYCGTKPCQLQEASPHE